MNTDFVPKLFTTLKGYKREQFIADITAGLIVGIVALPLAVAFAIASGVTPDRGLWTAIIAGFIISALGGSRVQIGGPTGAFVVIVYGIVQQYGVDGLIVATMLAGVILVVMGVLKFGGAIKFIPYPVVIGFTSGIALIIFSGQMKDFLGLDMGAVPAEFVEQWRAYFEHAGGINFYALGVAVVSLLIVLYWPRLTTKIPAPFVALVFMTLFTKLLGVPVETIGSRFGEISASIPMPRLPQLSFTEVASLVGPAFALAILGGVESLLSAVVADGMIGAKHRSNMELVGQGVANIASAMVGGIPATGALARTATNVKSGGRTPVAGMMHALTLLVITLFFGKWAAWIPMATLAAILIVVAYNMSEWRVFVSEFRGTRSDIAVLIATFVLTVFVDLTVAIGVGMVLASFLFMRRMAALSDISAISHEELSHGRGDDGDEMHHDTVPRDVQVYAINGPFFFGAADRFKDALGQISYRPKVLILRLGGVPVIDSTGLHALEDVIKRSRKEKTRVLLVEVQPRVRTTLERAAQDGVIRPQDFVPTLEEALARVRGGLGEIGTTGEHPLRRLSDQSTETRK